MPVNLTVTLTRGRSRARLPRRIGVQRRCGDQCPLGPLGGALVGVAQRPPVLRRVRVPLNEPPSGGVNCMATHLRRDARVAARGEQGRSWRGNYSSVELADARSSLVDRADEIPRSRRSPESTVAVQHPPVAHYGNSGSGDVGTLRGPRRGESEADAMAAPVLVVLPTARRCPSTWRREYLLPPPASATANRRGAAKSSDGVIRMARLGGVFWGARSRAGRLQKHR